VLRNLPLQRRLMSIMLLTSGSVLLLTCAGFLAYEFFTFRKTMVRELSTITAIIANNSTAALAFDDRQGAREILGALKAEPHIAAAGLYDARGRLFSTFPEDLPLEAFPSSPRADGFAFEPSFLAGFHPVIQGNDRLGTLYVKSDLKAVGARFRTYGMVAALVAAVAGLLAYLLSRTLQGQITAPVLLLAETARSVSERGDYSVRARKHGTGELSLLTDAFNQMLDRIQEQLARLELLNRITRAIGERLDLPSIFQVMVRTLEDNLPMDFVCVCLYDASSDRLAVTSVGFKTGAFASELGMGRGARVPVDGSGLALCVKGQVVYEPDISGNGHPFPMRLGDKGLRSLFLAPLVAEGKVTGVLMAARREADGFSALDRDFLRQLSEQAALATHQANLYGALQKAYDDLRQSQQTIMQQERLRALGQLASGIAHDINNAISPISLYVEALLEKEAALSPRGRDNLKTIARAIEDVAATVARMREFSRQRESEQAQSPVQLNRAVHQVMDLTRVRWTDMAQQKGLVFNVRTDLARDLPEVMGVESEIREALTNLFLNAFDAMPEGGTLTLRTRKDRDGRVLLEVMDTGVGMDEETRRRCLEPFYTTKGERGTGIGLAMVFGMVERHNADLEIDSAPGKGTTMRLVFPASTTVAPEPAKPARRAAPPGRMRILVVDDDPLVAKVLQDTMQIDGHQVTTADGGQAGIEAFRAALASGQPFDAVMTDLGMPYVDGSKVAAAVKEASPSTPVILLTGWGQRLQDDNEVPPHVDKLLAKPPKLADLRDALASLVLARD
jgi:signal transduction histidine kinase/ActR/RegA family two-component response regulator/HAMP domain-containing protein